MHDVALTRFAASWTVGSPTVGVVFLESVPSFDFRGHAHATTCVNVKCGDSIAVFARCGCGINDRYRLQVVVDAVTRVSCAANSHIHSKSPSSMPLKSGRAVVVALDLAVAVVAVVLCE